MIIDPDMVLGTAAFIEVMYVNIWLIILTGIAVILAVFFLVRLAKKSSASSGRLTARDHRRHGRSQVRYYSRSDSVDLREQYVKSGQKDRGSIRRLHDIGVSPPQKPTSRSQNRSRTMRTGSRGASGNSSARR